MTRNFPSPTTFSVSKLTLSLLLFLIAAITPALAQTPTDAVLHDLCNKSVALLGESPIHGFGKTLDFKVDLVRRLVNECHYNALFIESGTYDYINIQKKLSAGQPITDAMISAAIGGLWANKEVQSLIPFLHEKMTAGTLTLGGLDDQLDRGSYAQLEMPADLVQHLQGDAKQQCLATLQKHTLWQYTDAAPYNAQARDKIVNCLNRIEATLSTPMKSSDAEDRQEIASLKRNFARDFPATPQKSGEHDTTWGQRDYSMYLNFGWLASRLDANSKIIVWCATNHAAKTLALTGSSSADTPLGAYIHQDYKDRAFALGFSADSGTYASFRPPATPLTPAPVGSLENTVFAETDADTVYLSLDQLRKLGPIAARPLGTSFKTAQWDTILDGLILFRQERAPDFLPR